MRQRNLTHAVTAAPYALRSPRQFSAEYEHIENNPWKIRNNNQLFCQFGKVVLLDCKTLDSARNQMALGVSPRNIYVFENNLSTYNTMKSSPFKFNIFQGNIEDQVIHVSGKIGLMYLDYMSGIKCLESLQKTLEKTAEKFLQDSTLALTFTNRASGRFDRFLKKVTDILKATFSLSVQLKEVTGYQRSAKDKSQHMTFCVFSIGSPYNIITEFRPLNKKKEEKVKGSNILTRRKRKGIANILPDQYYDSVGWYRYSHEDPTWELHGSLDEIIEGNKKLDGL